MNLFRVAFLCGLLIFCSEQAFGQAASYSATTVLGTKPVSSTYSQAQASQAGTRSLAVPPTSLEESKPDKAETHDFYDSRHTDRNLREELQTASSDITVHVAESIPMRNGIPPNVPQLNAVQSLVCESELQIVGKVTDQRSHFSLDGSYIYTTYFLNIDDVLTSDSNLRSGDQIRVALPGGTITNGKHTVAMINGSSPLLVVGDRVILFLRKERNSSGYVAYPNGTIYLMTDGKPFLSSRGVLAGVLDGKTGLQLESQIRAVNKSVCASGLQGTTHIR